MWKSTSASRRRAGRADGVEDGRRDDSECAENLISTQVWRAAGISPAPDVATLACDGADGLVLASDGLWDVLSSDDAAAFVRANRLFRPERSAAQVAAALASRAAALGSTDDVSVVCVFFDR